MPDEGAHATIDLVLNQIAGVRADIAALRTEMVATTARHATEHLAAVAEREIRIRETTIRATESADAIRALCAELKRLRADVDRRTWIGGIGAMIGAVVAGALTYLGLGHRP